jgi:multidrug efflux pump subunit AcrA (membrane-fusion protein)
MIADPVRPAEREPPSVPPKPAAPVLSRPTSAAPPALRGGAALVLQARALRHERFAEAASAVLHGLGLVTGCERVCLGLQLRAGLEVVATCAGADVDHRLDFTDALGAAMQEAVDQRASIVYPLPPGSTPVLCFAHGELTRANGGLSVLTVPILGADRVLGALLLERQGGFDERAVRMAQDAALFVGPVLELKHRVESPVAGRLIESVAPRGVRLGERAAATWRLAAGGIALALLVAALWPVTFRVVAPARVEGIDQRILAAPVDGFIATVAVRPGEPVQAGQVLGTLDDRDLLLQRDRLAAEIGQYDKQYREALAGDDAGQIVMARAALAQAQAQHTLAESELERTRLRAPFDGVLVAGDLSAMVGSPVTRGQPLLTVSPTQGYKVVAEVDDQDVTVLQAGQRAQVLFAGLGQAPAAFDITRIAPVAVTLDRRNVFEVEGQVPAADAASLRPGLRGVARIDIDERLQVQVWWLRASHWLRRAVWQLMG